MKHLGDVGVKLCRSVSGRAFLLDAAVDFHLERYR